MQLFVLGPAFGLPSIDAECNAAVALLQLLVPDAYSLVPIHDTTDRLPHLIDGQASVSGYNNILSHFANKRIYNARSDLHATQGADSLAISSFVDANAQTLLDISLYVSFENYRLVTRPAFTKILPWHANYIVPPRSRAAARLRTEHLGISSIDVDNVHEDMSNRPAGMDAVGKKPDFEAETQKRASLLLPRKDTLRSLLQRPEHSTVFKLHALSDSFFGPLQELLGDSPYLLASEKPTPIDCLIYGYLSLMLYPKLPQDWLETTMRRKYRTLVTFTERMHSLLAMNTTPEAVLSLVRCDNAQANEEQRKTLNLSLPWSLPTSPTISVTLREIAQSAVEQLPLIGSADRIKLRDAKHFSFFDRNKQGLLLSTILSIGLAGYLTIQFGWYSWPHGHDVQLFGRRRLSDYGHLGTALAGLSVLAPQTRRTG